MSTSAPARRADRINQIEATRALSARAVDVQTDAADGRIGDRIEEARPDAVVACHPGPRPQGAKLVHQRAGHLDVCDALDDVVRLLLATAPAAVRHLEHDNLARCAAALA